MVSQMSRHDSESSHRLGVTTVNRHTVATTAKQHTLGTAVSPHTATVTTKGCLKDHAIEQYTYPEIIRTFTAIRLQICSHGLCESTEFVTNFTPKVLRRVDRSVPWHYIL